MIGAALMVSAIAFSQVGVNTSAPKTTMDVSAKRDTGGNITDNTQIFGLQAPRLTLTELTANTAIYGTNQQGALIYITDISGGNTSGQRININAIGYYFFNGSVWQKVVSDNIYNANGLLTDYRTLNTNGFNLSFTGTKMKTYWDSDGTLMQQGLSTSASKYANMIIMAPDNNGNNINSRMDFQIYPESYAQIIASNDATGLSLSTNQTTVSAPITFSTSTGSNALSTEKMRVTGEGNIGINTSSPTEKLDVSGVTRLRGLPLNGTANAIYTQSNGSASATQDQTFTGTRTVVADNNGVLGYITGVPVIQTTNTDATRYLGGTVYVRFNTTSGGTLANAKVIGGANGTSYSIGTLTASSSKGGINSVIGNGYTISNPAAGIFDIKFDTVLNNIYGISVNIVDAYGSGSSTIVDPDPSTPGNPLFTNDNTQVSFISNSIIRIKTGNSAGNLSNRSFTFLVTGK